MSGCCFPLSIVAVQKASIGRFTANRVGEANQTINNGVITKIQFANVVEDEEGWYNNVTFEYTPLIKGIYLFNFSSGLRNVTADGPVSINGFKNGARFRDGNNFSTGTAFDVQLNGTFYEEMNGTTDFMDIRYFQLTGNNDPQINTEAHNQYFQAWRIQRT